ncbi:MAG: response regulator [Desulfobacterales bacterium]|nr:response regulator [Desulfobacterales bacterium]
MLLMKKISIRLILLVIIILPLNSYAEDYKVTFMNEQYNEEYIKGGPQVKIYHTFEVKTPFGIRLLILNGEDYLYRKWLREQVKDNNNLLIQISDNKVDDFKKDMAFPIDIAYVHPIVEPKVDKVNKNGDNDKISTNEIKSDEKKKKTADNTHIMLINKDEQEITIIKNMLEHLGYNVTIAKNSSEGIDIFKKDSKKFDVILMDQSLPDMTGMQLAKKFDEIKPDIPVILSTAFVVSLKMSGVSVKNVKGFISKPVNIKELQEVLNKVTN